MKRNTAEFCGSCDEFYLPRAMPHLLFAILDYETFYADDAYYPCLCCGELIARHPTFLKALSLRSDDAYLTHILNKYANEVSPEAISALAMLIKNFTVPSFCTLINKPTAEGLLHLKELEHANLIAINGGTSHEVISLNAAELELYDRFDILELMSWQSAFAVPKRRNEKAKQSALLRSTRLAALINDFTDEQRDQVRSRFGNRCALTGKDVPIHLDHVIPVAWECGGTTIGNMLPIWQRINSSKSDGNIFDWYEQNGDRFEVKPELFREAIEYLAELNDMSYIEYREYVYDCERNFKQTEVTI